MRKSVMTVLAVLAAAAGFGAITGSITTDQGEQKGTIRWSARDKAYAVKGKNGIEVQVKPSDVVEMSINKPDGYDEAVEQVAKGEKIDADWRASRSSSPSRMLMAMIPLLRLRLLAYSLRAVFLTTPFLVIRVTKWLSVYAGSSIDLAFR